jgi:DsbC/DsbD-like thiol-disulfide interchange protein
MRREIARWAAAGLAIALATGTASAQLGGPAIPAPDQLVRISVPPVAIRAGGTATVPVTLAIAPTWHINANPPSPDYMIPTKLAASGSGGVSVGSPVYPAARSLKVGFDENPLAVYDQQVVIRLPVTAAKTAVNGAHVLKGTLTFQSCNDQVCRHGWRRAIRRDGAARRTGLGHPGTGPTRRHDSGRGRRRHAGER